MQNLMPQLDLPNKTIQQQKPTKASQPAGKSGKKGSKEDDFRNLLENSSKDSVLQEKETVSRQDLPEKPVVKTQDSTEKTTDAVDEETLQDIGMQAFQFLMMGSSQLEDMQITSDLTGDFVMQSEAENDPGISSLQDVAVDVPVRTDSSEKIEIVLPAQIQMERPVKADQSEDQGMPETYVPAVKDEVIVQQQGNQEKEGSRSKIAGEVNKLPEEKTIKRNEKVQTASQTHQTENKGARETGDTKGTIWNPEDKGTSIKTGMDHPGHYDGVQTYAAEDAFQQNAFQDQLQGMSGTKDQIVHIQADDPQELINQLMDQLRARTSLGDQEFEIQLHPENLGRMAIKVAYTAEKVSISIVCSNEKTMELLSSGARNIALIMEENLGAPTTVMVDQEESNYLEQHNDQGNSRQQQQEPEEKKKKAPENEHQDFLHQLRLGLI